MTKQLLLATSAAILLATPAFAQDNGADKAQSTEAQVRSPRDVTCREITALDTATVPGVLYFISGFKEGERSGGGMQSSDASVSTGSGSNQTADAAGSANTGSAGSTTATANSGNGTAQSADAGSASGAGSSTAGNTPQETTGATSGASTSADSGSSESDPGASSTARISSIHGYFDIPVEQTMIACNAEPDSKASDVIDRNRGMEGSSGGSGSAQ